MVRFHIKPTISHNQNIGLTAHNSLLHRLGSQPILFDITNGIHTPHFFLHHGFDSRVMRADDPYFVYLTDKAIKLQVLLTFFGDPSLNEKNSAKLGYLGTQFVKTHLIRRQKIIVEHVEKSRIQPTPIKNQSKLAQSALPHFLATSRSLCSFSKQDNRHGYSAAEASRNKSFMKSCHPRPVKGKNLFKVLTHSPSPSPSP